jgi:peroxiredoxin
MHIQVGDDMPKATFKYLGSDGPLDVVDIASDNLCVGKKVALFGLPGAFTPVCNGKHLPGFINSVSEIKSRGVDLVACVSGSDPFTMASWAKGLGAGNDILMLSDHTAEFTKAIGLEVDLSAFGLGSRSERYSMIITNGVIEALNIEDSILVCDVSSGEELLGSL